MSRSLDLSPRWPFTVLFVLMLALAASVWLFGSRLAQQLLVILIPFSGVVIGVLSAGEAQSTIESGLALVLVLSGCIATLLGVLGAGPFSNLLVNVALIGSLIGLRHPHPVQTVVKETRQAIP
jgi:hypothetical protein